jgi:hypothetical protein
MCLILAPSARLYATKHQHLYYTDAAHIYIIVVYLIPPNNRPRADFFPPLLESLKMEMDKSLQPALCVSASGYEMRAEKGVGV